METEFLPWANHVKKEQLFILYMTDDIREPAILHVRPSYLKLASIMTVSAALNHDVSSMNNVGSIEELEIVPFIFDATLR